MIEHKQFNTNKYDWFENVKLPKGFNFYIEIKEVLKGCLSFAFRHKNDVIFGRISYHHLKGNTDSLWQR